MKRPQGLGRVRSAAASTAMPVLLALGLAGCGTPPPAPVVDRSPVRTVPPPGPASGQVAPPPPARMPGAPRGGGFYQNDGPGDAPPPQVERTPDAVPRIEPLARAANRPYVVFGQEYVPDTSEQPYRERGHASWYGRQFHGRKTASGEVYDMYGMSAAHRTLPIPSYARVTNTANGESVIVRINDRGPFMRGRLIDLSYSAAARLGFAGSGTAQVEVERLLPGEIQAMLAKRPFDETLALAVPRDEPGGRLNTASAGGSAFATPRSAGGNAAAGSASTPTAVNPVTSSVGLADSAASAAGSGPATGSAPVSGPGAVPGSGAARAHAVRPAAVESRVHEPVSASGAGSAPVMVASLPLLHAGGAHFVQLGAFRGRANAESFRDHLSAQLVQPDASEPRLPVQINLARDGLHRVQIGPFRHRHEAQQVAERLRQSLDVRPVLVDNTPTADMPVSEPSR